MLNRFLAATAVAASTLVAGGAISAAPASAAAPAKISTVVYAPCGATGPSGSTRRCRWKDNGYGDWCRYCWMNGHWELDYCQYNGDDDGDD
jgi:hypothetical protein